MGRTIAVGQASLERAALAYAARELAAPGDVLLLIHAAAVSMPDVTVLHGAPHSVFRETGEGNPEDLYAKISAAVKAKVLSVAEDCGVPAVLQVKLLDVEATAADAAEAIMVIAKDEGASMLVLARDVSPPEPGAAADCEAADGGSAHGSEGNNKGSSGMLDKLAERARARAKQLVHKPSLAEEVLRRSGERLPVVLVPACWEERGRSQGPADSGAAAGAQ